MISFRQLRKVVSPVSEPEATEIPEAARKKFCAATGMSPIDDFKPEDVLIVGYPKSGNTWMQYLIASAIYQIDVTTVPDALVQDLVPDVHFKRFFKRYFPVTFFKSHHLPRPDYRKVVYLVRDGRDAMVSYLHFVEGQMGGTVDFLALVTAKEGLFPSKWHEHVEQWGANPFKAENDHGALRGPQARHRWARWNGSASLRGLSGSGRCWKRRRRSLRFPR